LDPCEGLARAVVRAVTEGEVPDVLPAVAEHVGLGEHRVVDRCVSSARRIGRRFFLQGAFGCREPRSRPGGFR
jgi:hypothetical protein